VSLPCAVSEDGLRTIDDSGVEGNVKQQVQRARIRSSCGFTYLRPTQILATLVVHNKHIRGLHELFLHTTRRDVDVVAMLDRHTTSSASHPAEVVEVAAERAYVVGWVVWVVGDHERVFVVCWRL